MIYTISQPQSALSILGSKKFKFIISKFFDIRLLLHNLKNILFLKKISHLTQTI